MVAALVDWAGVGSKVACSSGCRSTTMSWEAINLGPGVGAAFTLGRVIRWSNPKPGGKVVVVAMFGVQWDWRWDL